MMFDLLRVELLERLVGKIEVEVAGGGGLELGEDEWGVVLVEGCGGGGGHDYVIKLWRVVFVSIKLDGFLFVI